MRHTEKINAAYSKITDSNPLLYTYFKLCLEVNRFIDTYFEFILQLNTFKQETQFNIYSTRLKINSPYIAITCF